LEVVHRGTGENQRICFIQTAGEDIYLTGASEADQDFIAHARQDIPRLIAEIERLRSISR
jgi:hypothetical protein